MKRFDFFGIEVQIRTRSDERSPLNLLGDYLYEAQAAQQRGNIGKANLKAVRGLNEIARVVDPVNRNRLGLEQLQTLLADTIRLEENTRPTLRP